MIYDIAQHVKPEEPVAIERMAAADVLLVARRAATLAKQMTAEVRELYAKRFEGLMQELDAACICMRKGGPPDPDWIPINLRAEEDALVHD